MRAGLPNASQPVVPAILVFLHLKRELMVYLFLEASFLDLVFGISIPGNDIHTITVGTSESIPLFSAGNVGCPSNNL